MKAVIYTRVSTEEQKDKGFSLRDQKDRLERHCAQRGIEIVAHYEDDHSAKDFNRPAINRFKQDIVNGLIDPDLFITVRIDRFSRHIPSSIDMIAFLSKHNIRFDTVEHDIDLENPESSFMFTMMQAMAQWDNERRSENTRRGLRRAMLEGKWISTAPRGYNLARIGGNSTLVPNNEADFVRVAFQKFGRGIYSMDVLRKQLIRKHRYISKQQFSNMLHNPVYIGKIVIKEWKDEPEKVVDGLHKPLISEELFYRVQALFSTRGKRAIPQAILNPQFPLRGYLICSYCGGAITASSSKGNGGEYHYYHCQKAKCLKEHQTRYKAKKVNEAFTNLLGSMSIPHEVLSLYEKILEDTFKKSDRDRVKEVMTLDHKITFVQSRLESVEDKYADNLIGQSTYEKMTDRYNNELNELIANRTELNMKDSAFISYFKQSKSLLSNIGGYYDSADVNIKQKIISSIFPEKMTFDGEIYRTSKMNEVFSSFGLDINQLQQKTKKPTRKIPDRSNMAPPLGLEPRTL